MLQWLLLLPVTPVTVTPVIIPARASIRLLWPVCMPIIVPVSAVPIPDRLPVAITVSVPVFMPIGAIVPIMVSAMVPVSVHVSVSGVTLPAPVLASAVLLIAFPTVPTPGRGGAGSPTHKQLSHPNTGRRMQETWKTYCLDCSTDDRVEVQ
jgi:hypothetical protein